MKLALKENNCNKESNLAMGWNRYCTGINKIPGIKNDTIFGIYIGCACKEHDIQYSKEGTQNKFVADFLFACRVFMLSMARHPHIGGFFLSIILSVIFFVFLLVGGLFVWKTWSSKGVQRYK